MAERTHDELVSGMTVKASANLGAVEATLRGVGGPAQEAFQQLSGALTVIPGLGSSAVDYAAKLRADTSLPQEHRTRQADEELGFQREVIDKHRDAAVAAAAKLEGELQRGLLPQPLGNDQRLLVRDEIRNILGGRTGQALAKAALEYVGTNPSHDAELLSDWGRSLYRGAGVEKDYTTLQAQAIDRYLKRQDGSSRQVASRQALLAFRQANVPGVIAAYHHAGLMHLDRDSALPPPGQLQVASVTARGKTVRNSGGLK
jgi:hypothetical protein